MPIITMYGIYTCIFMYIFMYICIYFSNWFFGSSLSVLAKVFLLRIPPLVSRLSPIKLSLLIVYSLCGR